MRSVGTARRHFWSDITAARATSSAGFRGAPVRSTGTRAEKTLTNASDRICAVWGGGQILGRPILPLDLKPPVGASVPPSQPPFSTPDSQPPRPAVPAESSASPSEDASRPLGIPVRLEDRPDAEPTVFTGDWVITSPHLFSTLFPSRALPGQLASTTSRKAYLIAILRRPIPFPPRASAKLGGDSQSEAEPPAEQDEPDSQLFVFPPAACHPDLSSVTALQTGHGTMSCPEGYREFRSSRFGLFVSCEVLPR